MRRAVTARTVSLALVAWGLGALALAGCTVEAPALPEGVTATIFETRFDAALRQVQVRVTNNSDAPLTVIRASLESSRFSNNSVFDRPQVVPAGSARDLPITLGDPHCDEDADSAAARLEFEREDGASGSDLIVIEDTSILEAAGERDCRIRAVAEHATITSPSEVQWTAGAQEPATLDFAVTPTGASGSLTIVDAGNTTLLGLVDDSGARATPYPIDLQITEASEPSVIRLRIVPARCDPHAIAEDKQGTQFPFTVTTSTGSTGQIRVAVSNEVRLEIYEFVSDYCGLP